MVSQSTERVAAEIRAEMGRQKMTTRDLAKLLGWPVMNISRRVNGQQKLTLDDIVTIATALDRPISQFVPELVA